MRDVELTEQTSWRMRCRRSVSARGPAAARAPCACEGASSRTGLATPVRSTPRLRSRLSRQAEVRPETPPSFGGTSRPRTVRPSRRAVAHWEDRGQGWADAGTAEGQAESKNSTAVGLLGMGSGRNAGTRAPRSSRDAGGRGSGGGAGPASSQHDRACTRTGRRKDFEQMSRSDGGATPRRLGTRAQATQGAVLVKRRAG